VSREPGAIGAEAERRSAGRRREYYMGEGGGFPRVRAVVCLVVQSARGLSPTPKGVPECELTTLWFVLMQIQA